jgi:two-component system response regulator PilR (NtrC family)
VLAVDDERLMRMTLRHHLGELGYDVETVGSVKDALDRLDSGFYDLVLTDLALPDGSGLDVVQYARTLDSRVRTVVLTASLGDHASDDALEAGADAILLKPCSLRDLTAEADRVLDRPTSPTDRAV